VSELPPECGFHTSVKTKKTFLPNDLLKDICRAFVGACFVLESGESKACEQWQRYQNYGALYFNKLKWYNHEAFLATEVGNRSSWTLEIRELTLAPALQPVRTDNP
jgi:hypothetical protein